MGEQGLAPLRGSQQESDVDLEDRFVDSVIAGLGEFSTEELRRVIALRERVNPDCWSIRLVRDYIEVWR